MDTYACGLMLSAPTPMVRAAALILRAGEGCCSRINGEADDPVFRARLDQLDKDRATEIAAARKLWGMEDN